MPCYHPIPGYQGGAGEAVRVMPPLGTANLSLPCGRCLGCRTARAKEWGERCRHEAACHEHNIFATLTYDEAHCPSELKPDHLAEFIRSLRQAVRRGDPAFISNPASSVRYFASGEYGDLYGRPHYHAILFNLGCVEQTKVGADLWINERLTALWGRGEIKCGSVTGRSASYVAGYTSKKLGCDADGVVRQPPFIRCSRKPGIGLPWVRTFAEDLRGGAVVTADGGTMPLPRYYRKLLAGSQVGDEAAVARIAATPSMDRSAERLADAERIHQSLVALKGSRGF